MKLFLAGTCACALFGALWAVKDSEKGRPATRGAAAARTGPAAGGGIGPAADGGIGAPSPGGRIGMAHGGSGTEPGARPAEPAATTDPGALSPRIANYKITARLDRKEKTVKGRLVLRWKHTGQAPVDHLAFHLYMNAFKNESSVFMQESFGRHRQFEFESGRWGYVDVTRIVVDGEDRTRFARAQGCVEAPCPPEYRSDETVLRVDLSKKIPPGSVARVEMDFTTKLPKLFARTGYQGSFFMVAQWFPKIGVLEGAKWNCHAFHLNSEFYADFGVYDVELDLPDSFKVGASGVLREARKGQSGRRIHRFVAADVHDFAFAAGPGLSTRTMRQGRTVIEVLAPANLMDEAAEHMRLTARSIRILEEIVGPYPYPHLTVVVTPNNAHGAAGMEYAMLFTTGLSMMTIPGLLDSEQTTIHEFVHQYFQHILASNEFEEPWLDEGFTTYVTGLVADRLYGADRSLWSFAGIRVGYFPVQRLAYKYRPDFDPIDRFAWKYATMADYGITVYGKTCLTLKSLEGLIGLSKMEQVLQTYYRRFAFKHPRGEDFLAVLADVAGPRPAALFRRVISGTETLDHRVVRIKNRKHYPPLGLFGAPGKERKKVKSREKWGGKYESEILLHRRGSLRWPVEVEVTFANGKKIREVWDNPEAWKRLRYHRKSRVVRVQLDPDRKFWLDLRRINDGLDTNTSRRGPRRVTAWYARWLQLMMQLVGF